MSSDNGRRRVVVTGVGAISPCGLTADETWENIRNGRSGISKVEAVTMPPDCVDIGGEIKHFDPTQFMDKRTIRKTDRFAQISVNAAGQAIARFRARDRTDRRSGGLLGRYGNRWSDHSGDRP